MPAMTLSTVKYGDQSGLPAVGLHGGGLSGSHWKRLATEALRKRRWICPDLRGHGNTPSGEPPWTIAGMADDVLLTMDSLHVDRFDVLGHSLGGFVAAKLAARAPARVRRVVLLDIAVMTWQEWQRFIERWTRDPRRDLLLGEVDSIHEIIDYFRTREEQLQRGSNQPVRPHPVALPPDERRHVEREVRALIEPTPSGRVRLRWDHQLVAAVSSDLNEMPCSFGDFAGPVLLLAAGRSRVCTAGGHSRLRSRLGDNLTTVTIADSGHFLLWDAFSETATAIASFLQDDES